MKYEILNRNKFALLWGEAQMAFALLLLIEKKWSKGKP